MTARKKTDPPAKWRKKWRRYFDNESIRSGEPDKGQIWRDWTLIYDAGRRNLGLTHEKAEEWAHRAVIEPAAQRYDITVRRVQQILAEGRKIKAALAAGHAPLAEQQAIERKEWLTISKALEVVRRGDLGAQVKLLPRALEDRIHLPECVAPVLAAALLRENKAHQEAQRELAGRRAGTWRPKQN